MATKRINIWSSPRNISTAFMYSFAQRSDTSVVDEPLYAHFLSNTKTLAAHPGTSEILTLMENDGKKVINEVIFGQYDTEVVLFKQMTHHLIAIDLDFLLKTDNVLLIRDPKRIIASYTKVIPNPTIDDVGIKMQYELFDYLRKNGKVSAVIDTRELLLNPRKVLMELCDRLGLPFDEKMLSWQPGARPEDGCWAKYWYASVHKSTGFMPFMPKKIELSGKLATLAEACQPYYDQLYQFAIKHNDHPDHPN